MLTLRKQQLDTITWEGNQKKPQRKLVANTLTTGLRLSLRGQVDVAAGGGADGALVVEQPDPLITAIRIFDGSRDPIVDISPAEIRQMMQRQVRGQAAPGVVLATPTIQAATLVRRTYDINFANPRFANPIETALRPKDKDNFYLEVEWAGTKADPNGDEANAVIAGGTRSTVVSVLNLDVEQIHDPVAFNRVQPIFLPRIRRYQIGAAQTSASLPFLITTKADGIAFALLRTQDAGVVVENAINKISLRDDATIYREAIFARTWHEGELIENSALENLTGVAMGYFGEDLAQFGRLGMVFNPYQGGNPRFVLDITGAGTRIVELVLMEYERVAGLVRDKAVVDKQYPGLLD
jgi:hypothetical protein